MEGVVQDRKIPEDDGTVELLRSLETLLLATEPFAVNNIFGVTVPI